MFTYNTIEEALEELRQGRIILVRMMRTVKMKEISFVPPSLLLRKTSTSWQRMGKG